MGTLNVSDRFRLGSVSKDLRSALRDPRMWEMLNINKDLAKRLSKENEKGQNRLRQIVEYAGNGVKTLELHGAGWDVASLKTLLVDRTLTDPVFFENFESLTVEDVDITAPDLLNFLELFILPRRNESLRYDILPERFNITPCAACEGICQLDVDIDDGNCDPFLCPACGKTFCGDHNEDAERLCKYNRYGYEACEKCEASLLCGREGCLSSTSENIDKNTISWIALGTPSNTLRTVGSRVLTNARNRDAKRTFVSADSADSQRKGLE